MYVTTPVESSRVPPLVNVTVVVVTVNGIVPEVPSPNRLLKMLQKFMLLASANPLGAGLLCPPALNLNPGFANLGEGFLTPKSLLFSTSSCVRLSQLVMSSSSREPPPGVLPPDAATLSRLVQPAAFNVDMLVWLMLRSSIYGLPSMSMLVRVERPLASTF